MFGMLVDSFLECERAMTVDTKATGAEEAQALAWIVEINSLTCIVFATTLPKAKWIALRGYREAGYGRCGQWPTTSAGRMPRYDKSPLRFKKSQPWVEDYVRDTMCLTPEEV